MEGTHPDLADREVSDSSETAALDLLADELGAVPIDDPPEVTP